MQTFCLGKSRKHSNELAEFMANNTFTVRFGKQWKRELGNAADRYRYAVAGIANDNKRAPFGSGSLSLITLEKSFVDIIIFVNCIFMVYTNKYSSNKYSNIIMCPSHHKPPSHRKHCIYIMWVQSSNDVQNRKSYVFRIYVHFI